MPQACRATLEKALGRGAVKSIPLRAIYFDTPQRQLARNKVALRLRFENDRWVQTLKMSSSDSMLTRTELNHDRPGPDLDLTVYTGTPAASVIDKLSETLTVSYETQVLRLMRNSRTPWGWVEIAYDTGFVRSGNFELPLSEVEFELKRGDISAVFFLASKWQQQHGLIMDARSKAERGDLLTQLPAQAPAFDQFWRPCGAKTIQLLPDMTADQGLRAVMAECLDQIIRNTAILAEVDTLGFYSLDSTEHVHQLRVGIRRMRTAWSLFNDMCVLPTPEQRETVKKYFGLLGGSRDNKVLLTELWPALQAAGQPALSLELDSTQDDPSLVAKDRGFQSWLLQMSEFVYSPAKTVESPEEAVSQQGLKKIVLAKLQKWHRRILKDGARFVELDLEQRHDLRKRVKKLRYALQFAQTLLPQKKRNTYLKALSKIQNILGEMNDFANAQTTFISLRETQPSAWFACGWITHKLEQLQTDAVSAFKQLSSVSYWD